MLIKEYKKIFIGIWLIFIAMSGLPITIKTFLLYFTGGIFIFKALFFDGLHLKRSNLFKEKKQLEKNDTEKIVNQEKIDINRKPFLQILKKEKKSIANEIKNPITETIDEEVTLIKKKDKETINSENKKSLKDSFLNEESIVNKKEKKDFEAYLSPKSDNSIINTDFLKRISDK